ncbi:HAD family hydrolase [Sulfitobacter sp. F26169L]|uniref:sulfotransferase-like domain-containing protein n=1 Tax=Sulfitobacter sp. F26169L TaxID=2996015 RepID=UPI00226085A0|nr:HAD family hydrolase [Sulfitobacter sp. F26169L]MCX7565907.1 HAD family hydrolase [Sulfitobacter sp. F26169L]
MRIAMWSGPRNLSTAMMYAFGARDDFAVMDEPFYAPYLVKSGSDHPMADQIIAAHESDPVRVAALCGREGNPHLYMKHMPHHMLDGFPMAWANDCVNIHLIRHPARVIASYAAKRESPTLDDIGFIQQADLFDRLGGIVIDSTDIRADPEGMLRALCAAIELPFDPMMLHWPAGPRAEDGIWAQHWYGAVHNSTGIAGAEGALPDVPAELQSVLEEAVPYYQRLHQRRLSP